jgi:hypothetical protein
MDQYHHREVVSIVWKELGNRIEMAYAVGESERIRGSQRIAADLATEAGLVPVLSRDAMVRWERDSTQHETKAQDEAWEDEGGSSE